METRHAPLAVAVALLGAGCAAFNQTVARQTHWDDPAWSEVSRAPAGLALRIEQREAARWLSVVDRWECIEEATQHGVESEERKPQDWVLGVAGVLGGTATAAGVALAGGAITAAAVQDTQTGQQSGASQVVGVVIGVAGTFGQLLAFKKITQGLNEIRFERARPLRRELGRKVPCDERPVQGTLAGAGLPAEGLVLAPRARAPDGFAPAPEATLALDGRPVSVEAPAAPP